MSTREQRRRSNMLWAWQNRQLIVHRARVMPLSPIGLRNTWGISSGARVLWPAGTVPTNLTKAAARAAGCRRGACDVANVWRWPPTKAVTSKQWRWCHHDHYLTWGSARHSTKGGGSWEKHWEALRAMRSSGSGTLEVVEALTPSMATDASPVDKFSDRWRKTSYVTEVWLSRIRDEACPVGQRETCKFHGANARSWLRRVIPVKASGGQR